MHSPSTAHRQSDQARRLATARRNIQIGLGFSAPLTALYLLFQNYPLVLLSLLFIALELGLLRLLAGPWHQGARICHCVATPFVMLAATHVLGYHSHENLLLLTMLVSPFQIYSPWERRAALVSLSAPVLVLVLIEVLDNLGHMTGQISPRSQLVLSWINLLITLWGIARALWYQYYANAHAESDLEAAREAAQQASRLKSQFLANMSHEIRTPMNGVLGMTALALECKEAQGELREHLGAVQSCAQSLLLILNDILDLSKIEAGKLEVEDTPFSPEDTLRETLRVLQPRAREKGLPLTLEVAPDAPPFVRGDPLRLRQVVTNLVGNALKFTEAGSVQVRLARDDPGGPGERLRVEVQDTGIGIPRERQPQVFEASSQAAGSTTRRFGGTGLGLTISRDLARIMGGDLTLRSEPGRGSCFTLTVRMPEAPPPPPPPPAPKPVSSVGPLRILLAEDNPVNTRVVVAVLSRLGHEVVSVSNGAQALERARAGGFALVLMDVQMPEMDGLTATRRIREEEAARGAPRVPIIALTANAMKGDEEECLSAGMDAYLTKPIAPAALREVIQRHRC